MTQATAEKLYQSSLEQLAGANPPLQEVFQAAIQCRELSAYQESLNLLQALHKLTNSANVLYEIGNTCFLSNAFAEAKQYYLLALEQDPEHAPTLNNLAYCLQTLNDNTSAIHYYEELLKQQPKNYETLVTLTELYNKTQQQEKAIAILEQYAPIAKLSLLWNQLGTCYYESHNYDKAKACYNKALKIETSHVIKNNLALVFIAEENFTKAKEYIDEVLVQEPTATYMHTLALWQLSQDNLEEAENTCQDIITNHPEFIPAYKLLSNIYYTQGDIEKTLTKSTQALALQPQDPVSNWNHAVYLIAAGKLAEGWQHYEWGLLTEGRKLHRDYSYPWWDGKQVIEGKLLVLAEQGIGDVIYFAAFLQALSEKAELIVTCNQRLLSIFKRSFPNIEFYDSDCDKSEAVLKDNSGIQAKIALGSLPQHFLNEFNRPSYQEHYLTADKARQSHWEDKFAQLGEGMKVGLSWYSASPSLGNRVSLPLVEMTRLFSLKEVQFINFQYGDHQKDIAEYPEIHQFTEINPLIDMDEFAAQLTALDLLICIDNSTAVYAAALGVPSIILLGPSPQHIWGLQGDRMNLYPKLTIIRKPYGTCWNDVMMKVEQELITASARRN